MAPFIAPPDPQALLPPLLACLPTAFCSTRPPPALLPLLSPILRQRVQFLPSTSTTSEGSWLNLLCWDAAGAAELVAKVEASTFEPHPVSGEIELGDVGAPRFRRRDDETLQSLVRLPEHGLSVIYLWCENDEAGGGPGWRVSEMGLLERDTSQDKLSWSESMGQANAQFESTRSSLLPSQGSLDGQASGSAAAAAPQTSGDADEDDYWAQYDATPSRTPGFQGTSGPGQVASRAPMPGGATSEADYYARYGGVQPAMDNDDPDLEQTAAGDSIPLGNELGQESEGAPKSVPPLGQPLYLNGEAEADTTNMVHTRSSSSSSSSVVAHLENAARNQSHSEMAVQQHIGTSVKSLFRLARGAGIETTEFKRLIRTELDLLDLLEDD